MQLIGLLLFIVFGYVAAMFALQNWEDPALAVFVGCLVTSLSQRVYTITGGWK